MAFSYILSIRGQIGCLCILFYIAWTYFSVRRRRTVAHTLFSALIIISIIDLIFDMITVYTVNHIEETPMLLNRAFHVVFVSTLAAVLFIIFMYIRSLAYEDYKFRHYWLIPLLLSVLAVTFLPFSITESPYGNYSSGPFLTVAFVCAYSYFFLSFVTLIIRRKYIEKKSMYAIMISLSSLMAVTILQGLYPELLITSIGLTIINVALFYTVESPDAMLIEELAAERVKAESANQAKSMFLAQMSHEIRTPINAILGMNEMVLRQSDPAIREYAVNIDEAGKTLLALINSILDFSKIEDGKMELLSVPYDVPSVINNLIHSIQERALSKGLDLQLEIDPQLPTGLIGDDVRMTQVIMNLLTNAVKYTPRGSVTLIMKAVEQTDEEISLYVEVKDTGIGIKSEDISKLFVSFQRIEEKRNHNIEGTGLGMSIVSRLLQMMDSKLEVKSVYGEGSAFSFTVKQKISDRTPIGDMNERFMKSREKIIDKIAFKAPKARVLIVDDNAMNLKVARNLLGLYGIVPDLASSGAEAITKMRGTHYHVVCMDHMMPQMDGIETFKKLQEENLVPEDTVMLMMTANAVVGARENYLAAGFRDYISKPIEIEKMQEKMLAYLPDELIEKQTEKEEREQEQEQEFLEFFPEEPVKEPVVKELQIPKKTPAEAARARDDAGLKMALANLGIDAQTGLKFCAMSMDFYRELLSDLTNEAAEKTAGLNEFYEKKDYANYEILIHAIKGILRSIGEGRLSELAYELEQAAKKEAADTVSEKHPQFTEQYLSLTEKLRELL